MNCQIDLNRELGDAVRALTDADIALLVGRGIDRVDINLGLVGRTRIRIEGKLYEPDPEGGWAYITPARIDGLLGPESRAPEAAVRFGEVIDLVAWDPDHPSSWSRRTDLASYVGSIPPQYLRPDPVSVHRSIINWFRAGCAGLVLLSPDPVDQHRVLSACLVEDDRHATALRRVLERPWPVPPISTRQEEGRRHAA